MKKVRIFAVVLVGIMLISVPAYAFEKRGMQRSQQNPLSRSFDITKATEKLKEEVANGKITQEKADEVLAKMTENAKNFEAKKAEMIATQKAKIEKELANGKITQAQADKALALLAEGKLFRGNQAGKSPMGGFDIAKATEKLKEEVANGKITQEKADEILAKMTENAKNFEAKKAEMIATQKAKIEKELADGKITQEQADKALALLAEGKLLRGNHGKRPQMGKFDTKGQNQDS